MRELWTGMDVMDKYGRMDVVKVANVTKVAKIGQEQELCNCTYLAGWVTGIGGLVLMYSY